MIVAEKGMSCAVTVKVSNHGSHDVRLQTSVAEFIGPRTGSVITAANADGASPDGIDALYKLDQLVRGGETFEFEIELRFHPQGRNDSGTMTVANWPTVGIGVLGRSYERVSDMDFAFERTGPTPGCRLHTD